MKKTACLLLLLICLLPAALAEPGAVPQEVLTLCAEAHPEDTVAAADGVDGQYALVLTNGSQNRLCIAEREAGGYALTIDNSTALRQGAEIPELLMDTAGDALFYTYRSGETVYTYHAEKQNGAWGMVDVIVQESGDMSSTEYTAWVQDGTLYRSAAAMDAEDNTLWQNGYLPLPVAGLADRLTLAAFDISLLPVGEFSDAPEEMVRAALSLPEDAALERTLHGPYLFAEYCAPDGTRRVAACSYDEKAGYRTVSSQPLPEGWMLDDFHSWSEMNISNFVDITCAFAPDGSGAWTLSWVQNNSDVYFVFPHAIVANDENANTMLYAGDLPDINLSTMNLSALPRTLGQALESLDSSSWRVVNNPVPTDRLRLRDAPGGATLGRYYNGTPVQVLDDQGEWAHVRVGDTEGYMMTAYLAAGNQGVIVEGVQLALRVDIPGGGAPIYARPDTASAQVLRVDSLSHSPAGGQLLCGDAKDDWYHVLLLREGISGYIQDEYLWGGNG